MSVSVARGSNHEFMDSLGRTPARQNPIKSGTWMGTHSAEEDRPIHLLALILSLDQGVTVPAFANARGTSFHHSVNMGSVCLEQWSLLNRQSQTLPMDSVDGRAIILPEGPRKYLRVSKSVE
jgi:hypothetical protein